MNVHSLIDVVPSMEQNFSAGQTPLRHRRKDDRTGELILAALAIFQKKGFAATKIEDIAQAAGVAAGTVYRYFDSKEELFKAVIRDLVIPNLERMEEAAQREIGAAAQLRAFLRQWAEVLQSSRGCISKLIIAEAGNFPDMVGFYRDEVAGRVSRVLLRIVMEGMDRGEFALADPSVVVRLLISPLVMSSIWRHTFSQGPDNQIDFVALGDTALDLILHGLLAGDKANG
jgi:AcrR family transcriptional regulator